MSSEPVNMDWLKTDGLKSVVAQHFAQFSADDFQSNNVSEEPDGDVYKEAVQLILRRIESAVSGDKL